MAENTDDREVNKNKSPVLYKLAENKPAIVLSIALIALFAQFFWWYPVPLAAILVVLYYWLTTGNPWRVLGFRSLGNPLKFFLVSLAIAVVLNLAAKLFLIPLVQMITGDRPNLSAFDFLRGNTLGLIELLIYVWISAAIGEEIIYRGFIQKQLSKLFGENGVGNILAIFLAAVIFGLNHIYQGLRGVLITGVIGAAFGIIYLRSNYNIWRVIFIHGLFDTISLTLIYLSWDYFFRDFWSKLW